MAFYNSFKFAPPKWLPFQDQEILDMVVNEDFNKKQGKNFENPDFELKVVFDVHNYFATDLFQRIRLSDVKNEKLVIILSSPENSVFISVAENLNKFKISARNVHVFFLYEYANENGKVAPYQSPFSRSGQFMKNFYFELEKDLRMPIENIHFFTDDNVETYSKELEDLGGADVCYTALSWSSGIGAIDPDGFPASSLEEFLSMGSRLVTPMPEMIAHDSLRGMFGCSGDIGNVPPKAVTVGPKDLMASKEWIDVEYLVGCGGTAHQKFPLALSMFGPVCKEIPGSIMRLHKGTCYVQSEVATNASNQPDFIGLDKKLEEIKKKEERGE